MEMKVQIPFEQLLKAIKSLTPIERARLKQELNDEKSAIGDKAAYIDMLLKGPVFTEEQIQTIEENRKSIATWRTKR